MMKLYLPRILLLLFTLTSCASPEVKSSHENLIRVAVVNYHLTGGKTLSDQIERLQKIGQKAHEKGASFLLLPELMILDLFPKEPKDEVIKDELDRVAKIAPDYEEKLQKIALHNKLSIIGASTVIKSGSHFLNRAFFISSDGKVSYQDKVYPTPWEKKFGFVGGKKIHLFEDQGLNFVILICHDAEFPAISQALVSQRPEVIFVPSQTDGNSGLERVRMTSAARAVEHFSLVLMTGVSGEKDAPWHSYVGRNYFFTPQNKYFPTQVQSEISPHQETISYFDLDLSALREGRNDPDQVYPARDQLRKNK